MAISQTVTLTPGAVQFVVPAGARITKVQCWSGASSGSIAGSSSAVGRLAPGGAGSTYSELNDPATITAQNWLPGTIIPLAVGAGGAAVTAAGGFVSGNAGGDTFFGASTYVLSLVGSLGGGAPTPASGNVTALGGVPGAGKGDVVNLGGRGGNLTSTGTSAQASSGGGGSGGPDGPGSNGGDFSGNTGANTDGGAADGGAVAAGSGANGSVAGSGSSSPSQGGGGGGGGRGATSQGGDGGAPGGGGGGLMEGNTLTLTTGKGGDGKIIITYIILDPVAPHKRRFTQRRAA